MNPQALGRLIGASGLAVLAVGSLSLAGCASAEKDKREASLQAATGAYQSALRWGYFETAYGYVHPDQRQGKDLPPELKNLRVTSYDVVQPPLLTGAAQSEVTQVASIDYLYEDRQVVRTVSDRQVWRYDPKLQSWWLASGLPKFK
jgi:hypothetical protein